MENLLFEGQQLDQIYDFASKAGLQLIFDLNLLERSGHEWDPTNAIQLLQYASEHGYQIHFELGNGNHGLSVFVYPPMRYE